MGEARLAEKRRTRPPSTAAGPARYGEELLSADDLFLFNEGNHARLYDKLGAHPRTVAGVAGTQFSVWAPNAAAVSVVGDFNGWNAEKHPLQAVGASGIWDAFVPGVSRGADLQVPHPVADPGIHGRQGGPLRRAPRGASADGLGRLGSGLHVGRRRVDAPARRAAVHDLADVHLRGPPRLLAPRAGRGEPFPDVPRDRAPSRRVRPRDGLHARRASAGHGASLRRLVGLPGHGLLRADLPLRHAPGLHVSRRHAAPGRHRRPPRLGAVALSLRRARPRLLRRHPPLRARRLAQGLPARLGKLRLQLRPPRGPVAFSCLRGSTGSTASTSTGCGSTPSPR